MKAAAIAITLLLFLHPVHQAESLEKQALNLVQHTTASDLDPALPKVALNTWFNQLVGPRAGVIWQLSECGETTEAPDDKVPDLPACLGAHAMLPDGRKVVMAILVGSFKKGIAEKAAFHFGVIDNADKLRPAKKLSDLPRLLAPRRLAGKNTIELPEISDGDRIIALPQTIPLFAKDKDLLTANLDSDQSSSPSEEVPPPPTRLQSSSSSNQPQSIQQVVDEILEGNAITKVEAVYPPTARMMGAFGSVKVEVTISESGRVLEARAISGHKALRSAAVDAALKWVFKPTTINGKPIKVRGVLNFRFKSGQ